MDFNSIKIPKYNDASIEAIVNKINCDSTDPPVDVELIAEKLGFDLIPVKGLRSLSSTDAFLASHKKEIVFDDEVADVRIRFSIAHEIGHFYLHNDIINEIRFVDYIEWKKQLQDIPGWFWGTVERQANSFAAKLLVPRGLLIASISVYNKELLLAKKHSADVLSVREYLATPLARLFKVSEDVMRIRLNVERINPYEYLE